MDKMEALHALAEELAADAALPLARSANLVFGEGSPDGAVMFIGEAPGAHEDEQRRPFVGRAGQLLRRMIREVGWKEDGVYITNIVKRRPPENRDPTPEEIAAYEPYLTRQIAIIAPRVIVPLGRFAMNYFLPEAKITRDNGKIFHAGGRLIVPLFHPAAALRAPEVLKAFEATFRTLPDIVSGKRMTSVELPPAHAPERASPRTTKKPDQPKLF
jgi:DNA polymerase